MVVEGDPRRDRAHRVALELLNTERTYVDVLHLLDQVHITAYLFGLIRAEVRSTYHGREEKL